MATSRILIACLAIIAEFLSIPLTASAQTPYKEQFFEQTIDHFNSYWAQYGKRTYKQRYLIQDKWWTPGKGPIFFYTGNEGDIATFWNNTGFMFEIAPKFNALIVFAEHRYYGKSLPFGERSFKQPYISLLSSQQALADFAVLLNHLKPSLNATDCKVIAFGGSYGGMLSAYMRIKYPNLIDGSIAASAPVYLIGGDSSRDFFFEDVTADFQAAGCDKLIRDGFSKMASMSSTTDGLKKISSHFMLCKYMKTTSDFTHFLGWLRNAFTLMAMMDYPYPTDFMSKMPAWPVNAGCKAMKNVTCPVKGLADLASIVYPYKPDGCHDIWTDFVDCADPTGCGTGPDSYAWDYQACTDFLMPSGTNNKTDMFPILPFTMEQRNSYCEKRWGVTPDVEWTKLSFWGKDLKYTGNIVFSNGLLDPWHRGGVLEDLSDSLIAITIKEGAHHLDLRASNEHDPESVKVARQKEIDIITHWL
ncbi:hypothetical protein CAPTEDRAFT_152094 [Capitella teleta]|uniref:Uncharacterized protein n=1 Tax=Capitella teleta TaxID=283909 RepID=R7VFM7_CAPTE|nr:hypothetical protein CAPTEDRAFT_152094 [Capitella teleta]|eukprot:ELU17643.1 hypothetical protein CAPTEDRAFT_152094 [Capitella teleta]